MKSLEVKPKVLILNTEKKDKVNIYTFVNLDTNETETVVGVKENVPLHTPLFANITIRFNKEVLNLNDGTKKYLNVASLFLTKFQEIKE